MTQPDPLDIEGIDPDTDTCVIFATVNGNQWYRVWQRAHSTTYTATLRGLDSYHYSAGHATIASAEEWARRVANGTTE